ncbi:MAG TPA: inositol monophosphatase family protein [Coxiellaceae bacterium]|nr:inositol monophosphatase family protein [Coxiellaceae bacterium]
MNHPFITIAEKAARLAGRMMRQAVDRLDKVKISEKSQNDFVTEVDQRSEAMIIDAIREAYPSHSILGEEGGAIAGDETQWIIDPLDGTANFIHGFPHFSISIAVKQQGRLEAALIYDPLRDEMFIAARGKGAQLNQRKIRVSQVKKLSESFLGTGFPYKEMKNFPSYLKMFETITPLSSNIRRAGSAALDLAYVACGRLDGFWEYGLSPWDMAAGILLIREAGGMVSDFQGGENYFESGQVVAGTPGILKELLKIIRPLT